MSKTSRKPGRLYYRNEEEVYLPYSRTGPNYQSRYAEAAGRAELPRGNKALLQHLTAFHRFAEDVMDEVFDRVVYPPLADESERPWQQHTGPESYARLVQEAMAKLSAPSPQQTKSVTMRQVDTNAVLQIAWEWHKAICARGEAMTGLYAHCFMLSWTAFCKFFYLVIYENEALYSVIRTRRGEEYDYCRHVNREENVIITDSVILDYRVNEVWNSLQQIVPSLYRNTFTSHMKTYLYALFFRYCDIMWRQQDEADLVRIMDNPLFVKFSRDHYHQNSQHESGGSDEEEETEDSDVYVTESDSESDSTSGGGGGGGEDEEEAEAYEAYQSVTVPLSESCSLKSAYFFEGQLIFFSQLKRVSFSETLAGLCESNPLILRQRLSAETLEQCRQAVKEMVGDVALHPELKKFVKEAFKSAVVPLYLYHGETERFRAHWPYANNHAFDVLSMFRPNDNMEATKMLDMTAAQMLVDDARYEKEIVLLAKCCTALWLEHEMSETAVRVKINKWFIIEEQVSLDKIDKRIGAILERQHQQQQHQQRHTNERSVPLLLRLVRIYYVAHEGAVYRTQNYAEAFLLWMQLLVTQGHVQRNHLHQKIKSCLRHFIIT